MNKKQLYESIMRSVSHEVKKTLNEVSDKTARNAYIEASKRLKSATNKYEIRDLKRKKKMFQSYLENSDFSHVILSGDSYEGWQKALFNQLKTAYSIIPEKLTEIHIDIYHDSVDFQITYNNNVYTYTFNAINNNNNNSDYSSTYYIDFDERTPSNVEKQYQLPEICISGNDYPDMDMVIYSIVCAFSEII